VRVEKKVKRAGLRKPTHRKRQIKIFGLSREPTEYELDEALRAAGIRGIKNTPIQAKYPFFDAFLFLPAPQP